MTIDNLAIEWGRVHTLNNSTRTVEHSGCTLKVYATIKKLPLTFLQSLGLTDIRYMSNPAIRIPYFDEQGMELATRFRIALDSRDKFRWKKGNKPRLYRHPAHSKGSDYIVLVEGESDCHTLWFHGIPAVGLPGASNWQEEYAHMFASIPVIYVVIEPDVGGDSILKWLKDSSIKNKVRLVKLTPCKDPSAMHMDNPECFTKLWQQALNAAELYISYEAQMAAELADQAWSTCKELAMSKDILQEFWVALEKDGVVGQEREAKLLYLMFTSRLLPKPISGKVQGPSSAGKSFLVEKVTSFMPQEAYYWLTAMSDRVLVYSEEPMRHRILLIAEASALHSEFGSYMIRSLLSEGRINYEFVEKTPSGIQSRKLVKEGPTGFITTTTAVNLHPENETRLLTLPMVDTPAQTAGILLSIASDDTKSKPDYPLWHALQQWLSSSNHRVVIPYASILAELIPPSAIRLRRDFSHVLNLIKTHAILHQGTREKDEDNRIIATFSDYRAIHELLHDLIAAQVGASVPQTIRETVKAVQKLIDEGNATVSNAQLQQELKLDRSPVSMRVKNAIESGFLKNEECRKGKPSKLVLDNPMPEEQLILPTVDRLAKAFQCSSVKAVDKLPPSPDDRTQELFEERAAIMEYDGMSKKEAEREALIEVTNLMPR